MPIWGPIQRRLTKWRFSLGSKLMGQINRKLLQVLVRQARKDRLVYLVLAECRLIPGKAKAPQPNHDVHDGAPNSGLPHIIV